MKLAKLRIKKWQKKSEHHQQAWQAAEKMWRLMAGITPVNEPSVMASERNEKKVWSTFFIPASLAAGLFLIFALPNILITNPQTSITASSIKISEPIIEKTYENQWQIQHKVVLPDNSVVHLNFNSVINIRFSKFTRQIELIKGEAFFKVAKNLNKPFIVTAGNSTASALGTEFIVRKKKDNSSLITVTEGIVKVALLPEQHSINTLAKKSKTDSIVEGKAVNATPLRSVILTANESVNSTRKSIGKIQKVTSRNIGSWHRGVLIFKDTSLEDVLAEINRYTVYNIDTNLGYRSNEKITGTFFVRRLDEELSALITSLNLSVINNRNGGITLNLPRPKLSKSN